MFLGVDGGGTKTEFCLIDRQGTVVATFKTGSCYYFDSGIAEMERGLREGVEGICREAGITPTAIEYAFFGLPAYGESSRDVALLDEVPARILSHRRYQCDNDMICGWAGSLGAVDGINVIAGTGSMTYGENAGRKARCGGWGELFGDEGSAYWIATRGLSYFTKMSDGRLPKTLLHAALHAHFALESELDLLDIVLNQWQGDRTKIAALSTIIAGAAKQGDEHAITIFRDAARELAELVDATRQQLGFLTTDEVRVSYSGGVFNSNAIFVQMFQNELDSLYDGYTVCLPLFSPALGAAIYAAKLNNTPIDATLLVRRRV